MIEHAKSVLAIVMGLSLAACGSDEGDGGGSGGGTSTGGAHSSGGGSSTGGSSTGGSSTGGSSSGTGGAMGLPTCAIKAVQCGRCVSQQSCGAEAANCLGGSECATAFTTVGDCICGAQDGSDEAAIDACVTTFRATGGNELSDCVMANCKSVCGLP